MNQAVYGKIKKINILDVKLVNNKRDFKMGTQTNLYVTQNL